MATLEPPRGTHVEGLLVGHVQGRTLADRLAKALLPLEQALTVSTEIAEASSAAQRDKSQELRRPRD